MCVPPGMHSPLQTYLLAVFTGTDTSNPSALANAARCFFSCIPPGNQMAIQNYLLALLTGADTTNPGALANQAVCFETCLLAGSQIDVTTYLFAVAAGLSTVDPGVLSNRARCFLSCIPKGDHLAVQNYMLAQLVAPTSDASTLQNAARCFTMCVPDMGERALRASLLSQVVTCTAPLAPTNLAILLLTSSTISFTWTQPLNIPPVIPTGYIIKWGTSSGVYTNSAMAPAGSTGYTITGLNPSTTYFFVVQALSGLCESANSAELSGQTQSGLSNGLLTNLRAYWKMDENVASGSRADATGNGFTATDPNANVASSNAALIINCANIDTIAKGLSVAAALDQRAQTTPFSISFWFRQVDVRAGNSAFANLASGGTSGWLIYANSQSPTTTLHFYSGTDGGVVQDQNTGTNIDATAFNHVVFGYDGVNKFMYLNGVNLFNNVAVAGVSRTANPVIIGNYVGIGATTGLAARYDEIGYWFRVLSAADVTLLYNGGAGLPFSSFS